MPVNADHRRRIEDNTVSLLFHSWYDGFGDVKHRTDIEIDDFVEIFGSSAFDRLVGGDAGIINKNIDASVVGDDLVDGFLDTVIVV